MKNSKYIFLGIGVSYIVVAIMQVTAKGPLSAALYFTVAFIALELTLLELIKSVLKRILDNIASMEMIKSEYIALLRRNICAFEKHPSLQKDIDAFNSKLDEQLSDTKLQKQKKHAIRLSKFINILSVCQIVFCCVQIIITPLKLIPYDLITTKTINVLTLLSFALVFLSYFLLTFDDDKKQRLEQIKIEKNVSEYYLDAVERINLENEQNQEK